MLKIERIHEDTEKELLLDGRNDKECQHGIAVRRSIKEVQ
jgi:hypothetical protein